MVAARHPGAPGLPGAGAGGRQSQVSAAGSDSDEDPEERFEKRVLKPLPVSQDGGRGEEDSEKVVGTGNALQSFGGVGAEAIPCELS